MKFMVDNTILGASILLVNFETNEEKEAYMKATQEAYEAIRQKKYLSVEEQSKLEQAVIDATRNFVRFRRVLDSSNS